MARRRQWSRTPVGAPSPLQRTLVPMRTLSHSQDEQAWELLLVLMAANPDASPAALVQKAYEVATEFERVRKERAPDSPHPAEPTPGQAG